MKRYATRWQEAGTRLILALFVATLLTARIYSTCSSEMNRFYRHWSRGDGIALVSSTVLLALAGLAVYALIRATGRERWVKAYGYAFVAGVGTGVTQLLPVIRNNSTAMQVFWGLLMAAIAVAAAKDWRWIVKATKTASLTFSLLVPLLFYQALTWSSFDTDETRIQAADRAPASQHPVFLFLFDEWSYHRATRGGEFRAELPNFRSFSNSAILFWHAQSEGDHTFFSVPRLLFQRDTDLTVRNGRVMASRDGKEVLSKDLDNVFSRAKGRGYTTGLVGIYLPYGVIFGDDLDACIARTWGVDNDDFVGDVLQTINTASRFWPDPLDQRWSADRDVEARLKAWYDILFSIHRDSLNLLRTCPNNTFAFFHSAGTHPPAVADENGKFLGWKSGFDIHLYELQMRFIDRQFGELIETLKAQGKFDNALVVVCSDHSLKMETDPNILSQPGWMFHVPLIVKWPGQRLAKRVDRPFSLVQLQPLLDAAMDGKGIDEALRRIDQAPLPKLHQRTGILELPPTGVTSDSAAH